MKLVTRIALGALAGATLLTGMAATPALARTDVYAVGYRDRDYRRDRDWRRYDRHDRHDRYDRRWDRRGYYGYRDRYRQRCWTDWRWDRWRGRYAVRICR